jgi:glycolate oxidase FAD binding subunit
VARAATLPGDLEAAAAALARSAGRQGVEAELASHAGTGLHTARLRGGDAAAQAEVVRRWRAAVTPRGGTVVLRRRLPGVDDLVDPWFDAPAGAPSSLALMRRVKASLDPEGRCAPGRFVGGI